MADEADNSGKSLVQALKDLIAERYIELLPKAQAEVKDLTLDQLKDHIARKDATMTAVMGALLSLGGIAENTDEAVALLTKNMAGFSTALSDIPKQLNKLNTDVEKTVRDYAVLINQTKTDKAN